MEIGHSEWGKNQARLHKEMVSFTRGYVIWNFIF